MRKSNLDPLFDLEPEKLFTFEKTVTRLAANEAVGFGIRRTVFLLPLITRYARRGRRSRTGLFDCRVTNVDSQEMRKRRQLWIRLATIASAFRVLLLV